MRLAYGCSPTGRELTGDPFEYRFTGSVAAGMGIGISLG